MALLWKIYKSIIFILFTVFILFLGIYLYTFFGRPIQIYNKDNYILYDINNNIVENAYGNSKWTNLEDINQYFIDAIISIEDKNFYNHNGFDFTRIMRAIIQNIKARKIVTGASTISQQYVKNAFLSFNQTWERKFKEALLTINLETHYSKKEILEAYINTINYGKGNYSIESASLYYFNKKPIDLTLEEAIILAGIPKNPNNYNPESSFTNAKKRALVVAKAMLDNNKITKKQYNDIDFDKVILNINKEEKSSMIKYYEDALLNELTNLKLFSKEQLQSGKLRIYSSLDINSQLELEKNINKYLIIDDVQIASVIINPMTGGVLALTGGLDYNQSEYNRALYSKRQVGSTMKPFLYYAALEEGLTSATTFLSQPTSFHLSTGQVYTPKNYGNIYANKEITMASAISYSDNIYAVKTNLFLGSDKLIKAAHKCGIKEDLKEVVSLPLGTSEINILDFANGYLTLASGGYEKNIHFIEKITDDNGKILYQYENKNNLVLNPNYVYILNEALTATSNKAFIDYNMPTAMIISNKASQKYAFKSGTTNTDHWAIGYNKDKLMLIWTGFDNNKSITTGLGVASKNIWIDTMENIKTEKQNNWYSMPKNVVGVLLNAVDGTLPYDVNKSIMYYFVRGTEPIKNQDNVS